MKLRAESEVDRRSLRSAARDLAHDLGKHLPRIARNVTGVLPDALRPLLIKDLYALDGSEPASRVFAAHRARVEPGLDDVRLEAIASRLARIDALRAGVEAADDDATREAITLAIEVSELAREIERDVTSALAGRPA